MYNLLDLELRVAERQQVVQQEMLRGALLRQVRGRGRAPAGPGAGLPVRVRLGLALIRLGARLAA